MCFLIFFIACSKIPSLAKRENSFDILIKEKNLQKELFKSNSFDLLGVSSSLKTCKNLNIYIEGDGLSWISKHRISSNPTPINPLALKLMLNDSNSCKLYLARPCQYIFSSKCEKKYWTSHRFSEEIIDSYNQIITNIKQKYKISSFTLIGYSGGGAIATLLAQKREDVSLLVTIAGNINTKEWIKIHNISPLYASLNPADFTSNLQNIQQYHLIGGKDKIVPFEIFHSFYNKFNNKSKIKYKIFKDFTHLKGWVKNWNKIEKEILVY
jgi:hypothetical protein